MKNAIRILLRHFVRTRRHSAINSGAASHCLKAENSATKWFIFSIYIATSHTIGSKGPDSIVTVLLSFILHSIFEQFLYKTLL